MYVYVYLIHYLLHSKDYFFLRVLIAVFVTVLLQLWGRTLYSFGELLIIEFLLENNSAEQNSRDRVIELT